MKKIDKFVNVYPVSKTLKFKLIPVGKTKENFDKNKLLEKDKERLENFGKAKTIIDRYYDTFITNCLKNFKFNNKPNNLKKYYDVYLSNIDKKEKSEQLQKLQVELRKEIVYAFKGKNSGFTNLFGRELFGNIVEDNKVSDSDKNVIEQFQKFTTYFTGFFTNRKNIFNDEGKVGSIVYRCINENLSFHVYNIKVFDKIKPKLEKEINELEKNMNGRLHQFRLQDVFSIEYFNHLLTGADINNYNSIIGGFSEGEKDKIQGLNEYINLYNQKHKEDKLPKFKNLYKQILSEDSSNTFRFDCINNDEEAYNGIDSLLKTIDDNKIIDKCKELFDGLLKSNYEIDKIYYSSKNFTELSKACYSNYNAINVAIGAVYDNNHKKEKTTKNYEEKKKKHVKDINCLSLKQIEDYVAYVGYDKEGILKTIVNKSNELLLKIEECIEHYKGIDKNNKIKDNVEVVKDLLDSLLKLYKLVPIYCCYDNSDDIDEIFYSDIEVLKKIDVVNSIYNKIRNYATKKSYKLDKIKLNFNKPNLLQGWVDSKTDKSDNGTQYSGYLFRKKNNINEYDYYLGISEDVKLFRNDSIVKTDDLSGFERLDYYQLKSDTIGKAFSVNNVENRFNNLKNVLLSNKRIPNKYHNNIKNCKDLDELRIVADNIIKNKIFNYFSISQKEFQNALDREEKPLYLFKISNRDLSYADNSASRKSRGTDNLHTMYFKMLMNGNQENYDLGTGEIFFREASEKDKMYIVHRAYEPIDNKSINYNKKSSTFKYDIVKNKRFYEEQFLFHLSIKINYKGDEHIKNKQFNSDVNKEIKKCDDNYVIGIDRGERNLIYINVVSEKRGLREQLSLNDIINEYKGNTYTTNYHTLLNEREKERDEARKSWTTIENIKELKEGYVSQVVHKICQLVEQYDAIIVMEDLNSGFKNSRIRVEKQVYQKFEKMLIDKLNLYVNKNTNSNDNGGLLKAYQLTRPYEGNRNMSFQNGFIFYIAPWNTSKIDPTTGFVNLFRFGTYTTLKSKKEFINRFQKIIYNNLEDVFEFTFNYDDFECGSTYYIKKWTISSYGKRILTFRNKNKNSNWDYKEVDLTKELKNLLAEYKINYDNVDIKEEIFNIDNNDFFDKLFNILKLILQIRNSVANSEIDYLASPVKNNQGKFYNSNEAKDSGSNLPQDADSNGAFNIARKGLMIVERIKKESDNKRLTVISNKDWLEYAQTHLPN